MKKLVLMMVIGLGAAFAAQADLLYFKVSAFDWSGPKYFDFAQVFAKNVNTGESTSLGIKLTYDDPNEAEIVLTENYERYNAEGWANISEKEWKTDDYVFYVSAMDAVKGEEVWGYSEDTAKSYAQLLEQGSIYIEGSTQPQDVKPWNVPEPTSGMLLLLGSALLALKRKREK